MRSLSDKDKKYVNFEGPDRVTALDVFKIVYGNGKKEHASWSYRKKDGEMVTLGHFSARVANVLKAFTDLGDAAAQIDPIHTALPWAGLRFFLQVHFHRS